MIKAKEQKAITLIALIITIIVMLILASVGISLTLGENGIFNRATDAKEKYKIAEIREKVELAILEIEMREVELRNEVTIEKVLQELLDNKTFKKIDKAKQTGNIEDYEVKLKYNENNKVIIEYIKKSEEVTVTYTLNPSTYTNKEKVTIKLVAQGKIKSITNPKGEVITTNNEKEEIKYEVETNGTYKFIIENKKGEKEEKDVIVDIIDREPPKEFTITAESTTGEIKITGTTEDTEANETSVKSGISHYKYYAKLTTEAETEYKEYNTNEIRSLPTGESLPAGTYNVYAKAFDKAGNWATSNTTTVTVAEWIQIWDEAGLRNIANGLNKNYIIMQDIELKQDWTTIGQYSKSAFSGHLEGNNNKITGFKMKATKQWQGFFSYIEKGSVSNLSLEGNVDANNQASIGILVAYNIGGIIENVKIVGTITNGKNAIGGIAGYNQGKISNSYAKVIINGISEVGGLVGHNSGQITGSYSTGKITGTSYVGGLIGSFVNNGCTFPLICEKSASNAEVTGNDFVGGLVGENNVEIADSYSTGKVTGKTYVGGIVGNNNYKIKNTYSIAKITGTSYVGGLVGNSSSSKNVTNSYYTQIKSEVNTSAGGTLLTLDQMKNKDSYSGWDFTSKTVWKMKEFPQLIFKFIIPEEEMQ